MTEQDKPTWLDEESKNLGTGFSGEKKPALKFEEGKIYEIAIDFDKPFEKYTAVNEKGVQVVKAIIPIEHNKEKKIFWLNVKNPLYHELIDEAKKGKKVFKIIQIGTQQNTKYKIIKE